MSFLSKIFNINNLEKKSVPSPYFPTRNTSFFFSQQYSATWNGYNRFALQQFVNEYLTLPEVKAPVKKLANSFVNGKIKIYETKGGGTGKEIEQHPILNLIQNPNFFQGKAEFFKMLYTYYKVCGFAVIYINNPVGFSVKDGASRMYILPSEQLDIRFKVQHETVFNTEKLSDIVQQITLNSFDGRQVNIDLDNIIIINETGIGLRESYYFGSSDIQTLDYPITNVRKSYEAENIILEHRGAIGLISGENTSGGDFVKDAPVPLDAKEREVLELAYSGYGLMADQKRLIVTPAKVKYTPMIQDVSKLRLFESRNENAKTISKLLGVPPILMSLDDATFSNVENAEKQMYQNEVLPTADYIFNSISTQLLQGEKLKLVSDYSHIACLQEDEREKAEKNKLNNQIIIDLNTSVQGGVLTKEVAIFSLQSYGYSEEDANKLIADKIEQPQNNNNNEQ